MSACPKPDPDRANLPVHLLIREHLICLRHHHRKVIHHRLGHPTDGHCEALVGNAWLNNKIRAEHALQLRLDNADYIVLCLCVLPKHMLVFCSLHHLFLLFQKSLLVF
jgi:hypothetical protein